MLRRTIAVLGVAWLAAARSLGAQGVACDNGATEVRALEFTGNETFSDAVLANRIATTASSWTRRYLRVIGRKYCLDSLTVSRDSLRLILFYNGHGFTDVKVGREIRMLDSAAAIVRFDIAEGRPMMIDSLTYSGLDDVPERARILRGLPLRPGNRFDRFLVEATRDTLIRRLRDRGYPTAEVFRSFDTDTARRTAMLEFSAATGPRQRIGEVDVRLEAQPGQALGVRPERVLALLGIERGDLFSQRDLEGVKRGLYLTEAFQHVDVSVDSSSLKDPIDSLLTVRVSLTEAKLHSARVAAGWGSFDCFRTQAQYTDYNFLHGLRRLDLTGRLSKISNGRPLRFGDGGLCTPSVRRDLFSDTLNYYVGATISQAALFGQRILPSLSLYSERRSELSVFLRDVPIGLLGSVQYEARGGIPIAFSYQLEYGRTSAQPAYFCQVFQICDAPSQGFLLERRRSAVVGTSAVRNRSNDPTNPTHGSVVRLELRNGSRVIGSDPLTTFTRAVFDASLYRTVFDGGVFVLRLRAGSVLGSKVDLEGQPRFIPPQERMYAGGPNSVRGFRQNQLGSLIFLVDTFDIVANPRDPSTVFYRARSGTSLDRDPLSSGGDNVVVANAELRVRSFFLPDLVQYALFADAGEVWNRGAKEAGGGFKSMKVTPGIGLRVFTAIGPVRVDVGYNPYQRPRGPAYFNTRSSGQQNEERPVYCVSPLNELPVPKVGPGEVAVQAPGPCPATFADRTRTGFFNRLTFNFSLGQAF